MLFKNVELINKLQTFENKLDVIINNFNVISFNQENTRCCDCETRERNIYNDLTDYIESKFKTFENDIVGKLDELKHDESKSETPEVTQEDVKRLIDEHKKSLTEELRNICTVSDKNLRQDLNSCILGIKSDIVTEIKKYYEIQSGNSRQAYDSYTSHIIEVSSKQNVIDSKIDSFYYDNEIIKHQLLLEEEIRKYYDEITSLKLTIDTTMKDIDELITKFK